MNLGDRSKGALGFITASSYPQRRPGKGLFRKSSIWKPWSPDWLQWSKCRSRLKATGSVFACSGESGRQGLRTRGDLWLIRAILSVSFHLKSCFLPSSFTKSRFLGCDLRRIPSSRSIPRSQLCQWHLWELEKGMGVWG